MNRMHFAAVAIVAILSISALVPLSHGSNITVYLNPNNNEATVDAYINSTLFFSLNSTNPLLLNLTNSFASGPASKNVNIPETYLVSTSNAFKAINKSLAEKDPSALLTNLSLSYLRNVEIVNTTGHFAYSANSSLKIGMAVTGIFTNNTVSMGWRGFSTNQNVSLDGQEVNTVSFNDSLATSSGSVNILNMSVFSKSLLQWNKSYEPLTNTTFFTLNAGKTIDMNYTESNSAGSFYFTFTVDPSYSIAAPGFDSATANSITIGNPPPENHVVYFAVGAILVSGFLISMYFGRRRAR